MKRESEAPPEEDLSPEGENSRILEPGQMDALNAAFRVRMEKARRPAQRLARMRIWLVFLLIRYAGLRLGEVLGLDEARDILLSEAKIRAGGAHAREIPMSLPLLTHLQRMLLDNPAGVCAGGGLTRLDQGYVRRSFYARAKECGLPPEAAAPRALRRSRAVELVRGGLPLPVVEDFLGHAKRARSGELASYSGPESARLLRDYLHRESIMKTSARNVFSGRVTALRQYAFLVEVVVKTLTGLEITSVITEESCRNLNLFTGKTIVATIKAPWVTLHRDAGVVTSARNRFTGRITRVQRSDLAAEVVLELADGSRVCALAVEDIGDFAGLEPGDEIGVSFKAFAVVLTAVKQ
jgi:molybdate transport system regulatory protein